MLSGWAVVNRLVRDKVVIHGSNFLFLLLIQRISFLPFYSVL